MSARDDYANTPHKGIVWEAMCDQIDRLTEENLTLRMQVAGLKVEMLEMDETIRFLAPNDSFG